MTFYGYLWPGLTSAVHVPREVDVIGPFFAPILANKTIGRFICAEVDVVRRYGRVYFYNGLLFRGRTRLEIWDFWLDAYVIRA